MSGLKVCRQFVFLWECDHLCAVKHIYIEYNLKHHGHLQCLFSFFDYHIFIIVIIIVIIIHSMHVVVVIQFSLVRKKEYVRKRVCVDRDIFD